MERIVSRQNPLARRFREAASASSPDMLLDGAHLVEEALRAGLEIEVIAVREDLEDGPIRRLAETAAAAGARAIAVPDRVLAALSPVQRPSGIVALARPRRATLDYALHASPQLVIVLAGVQDPGNVGAIIRAADACGATGVVAAEGTADPLGWKALRGSMGSVFRLPVASRQPLHVAVRAARDKGMTVYAAVPRDGEWLPRCDLERPVAVLLGGEGQGVPANALTLADRQLTIPMRHGAESLNVATAAALIVYEATRQRQARENGRTA